jgi:hypothetical protein
LVKVTADSPGKLRIGPQILQMQRISEGMNIQSIDFDRLEVYEAGALLVTLLAYPEEGEETRSEVHASLCACAQS